MIKHKRHTTQSGHHIDVYDGLFDLNDRMRIVDEILLKKFEIGDQYDKLAYDNATFNQLLTVLTRNDLAKWGIYDCLMKAPELWEMVQAKGLEFRRGWCNLGTSLNTYRFHTDAHVEGCKTFLYYASLEWNINWDGYTVFRTPDLSEIEFVSEYKPGRLVVFDSIIPHKATAIPPEANQWRFIVNQVWVPTGYLE